MPHLIPFDPYVSDMLKITEMKMTEMDEKNQQIESQNADLINQVNQRNKINLK